MVRSHAPHVADRTGPLPDVVEAPLAEGEQNRAASGVQAVAHVRVELLGIVLAFPGIRGGVAIGEAGIGEAGTGKSVMKDRDRLREKLVLDKEKRRGRKLQDLNSTSTYQDDRTSPFSRNLRPMMRKSRHRAGRKASCLVGRTYTLL